MATKSKPILCAYDGSANAQRAVELAADLATRLEAQLILVHSYHLPPELEGLARHYATGGQFEGRVKEGLEAESQSLLHNAAGPLGPKGLDVRGVSWIGEPGQAIVKAADTFDAGWILVGTRGRSGIRRLLLGSVASYVVHHAGRPVVVVP